MLSPLTYKVVAFPAIEKLAVEDCIDWAMEMLELGYETPRLLILASFEKGDSYFEIKSYLEKAILELGLEIKFGEEAIGSYVFYYVTKIAEGEKVRQNLSMIYGFWFEKYNDSLASGFIKLHWAWQQLDYEDNDANHYWDGANRENIEQIVVSYAQEWMALNGHLFKQANI